MSGASTQYRWSVTRLFVALWPPDDVIKTLAGMPRPATAGVRWVAVNRLHVTLRFLGEAEEASAVAALRPLRLPASTVALGPTVRRLGRGVAMIPVDGVDDLAEAVVMATGHLGWPPPDRPFMGHLTVARLKGELPHSYAPVIEASFPASEVTLVRVEPSGAYADVERFALEPKSDSCLERAGSSERCTIHDSNCSSVIGTE